MRKIVLLSTIASTLIMAGGDISPVKPEVSAQAVDYGTFSGQLRGFYIDRTYEGIVENNRNSLAVGGWLGYDSPTWNGLSFGAKVYGTNGFDIHDIDAEDDTTNSMYDPSLYGRDNENYIFVGELYLNYKRGNTSLKVGRQRLDTPMAGADDARMLPNLFEAAVLTNTDLENTTLVLAHVTKETVGTFGNIYGGSTLGLYSGYGLGMNDALSGDFVDMGEVALGAGNNTDGVTAVAAIHKYDNGLKVQAWDYYAYDILNVLYAQADFSWACRLNPDVTMSASAQYINEEDVGDSLAGSINSNYFGMKLGAALDNLSGYVAYSTTDDGVISPWGGMPAFTQGMVTRHQFFPDTDAYKVALTYNFKAYNVKATAYYTKFEIGANDPYVNSATDWEADESGFDVIYQASNDLQLRFRGNFPTDFKPGLDWSEYRLIVNYNF